MRGNAVILALSFTLLLGCTGPDSSTGVDPIQQFIYDGLITEVSFRESTAYPTAFVTPEFMGLSLERQSEIIVAVHGEYVEEIGEKGLVFVFLGQRQVGVYAPPFTLAMEE